MGIADSSRRAGEQLGELVKSGEITMDTAIIYGILIVLGIAVILLIIIYIPKIIEALTNTTKKSQNEVTVIQTEINTPREISYCMYCGKKIQKDCQYCPFCGHKILK